jgi:expansin (peptidoglycan-binding protein)
MHHSSSAIVFFAASLLGGCSTDSVGDSSDGSATAAATLPAACPGNCNAATPTYPNVSQTSATGNVTMYATQASSGGACLYGDTQVMFYAAINVNVEPGDATGQWQEGRICGQCAKVKTLTTQGLTEVVVRIMDKCADANCGIDLGGDAPNQVMLDGFGRYDGTWEFVSCVGHDELFDGPTALFVKDGSNAYWAAVQVRNPPMAVTAMHWQNQADPSSSGDFGYASPEIENYFLVPVEVLQTDSTFDITVVYGDESTNVISLTSTQLGTANSSYSFE